MEGVVGSLEQALTLIAAVAAAPNNRNNHRGGEDGSNGISSVKLTSLQQLKQLLLSLQPSLLPELFPFLLQLHSEPEPRLRLWRRQVYTQWNTPPCKYPSSLRFYNSTVANQSILSGTTLFTALLKEIALLFPHRGRVHKSLQHLWTQMLDFKDAVFTITFEEMLQRSMCPDRRHSIEIVSFC